MAVDAARLGSRALDRDVPDLRRGRVLAPVGLVLDRRRRPAHRLAEGHRVLVRVVLIAWMGILFLITVGIFLNDELVVG